MKRPILWAAAGWLAGSLAAAALPLPFFRWCLLSVPLTAFGGLWVWRHRRGWPVFLLLLGLCVGGARFVWVQEHDVSRMTPLLAGESEREGTVRGEVETPPEIDGDSLQFEMRVVRAENETGIRVFPDERMLVRVRLTDPGEVQQAAKLKRKTGLEVKLRFREPSLPRNPGAFDYRAHLSRRGIHLIGDASGMRSVRAVYHRPNHPLVRIDEWRSSLGSRIGRLFPEEHAGLVRALLLGERQAVPPETEEAYRELGIVHVLSISGMHVAVLAAAGYFLLKRLGLTREKAAALLIPLLPVYACLTGLEPPVVRAALTAGLGLLAVMLNKERDLLSFLALALLVQLAWEPRQLQEAGFQLTYLVTAALVAGTQPLAEKIPLPLSAVRTALAASVTAAGASFPVVIAHFHEFSLLSLVANLLVAPLVGSLAVPLASGALVAGMLHEGWGQVLAVPVSWLLGLANAAAQRLHTPHALTVWPAPPVWWFPCYAVFAVWLWLSWVGAFFDGRTHRRLATAGFAAVLLVAWWQADWSRDGVRVTFLDVGQGDAAVIETENGRVILVDGGGLPGRAGEEAWRRRRNPFDPGRHVVVPYLKYRGIREIDELVITHGDLDHIGGLLAVAERFPVRRAIVSGQPVRSEAERKLLAELAKRGTRITAVRPGAGGSLDRGVGWRFLHPSPEEAAAEDQPNRGSVVFLLEAYGFRIMMTGDADLEAERRIMERWDLPAVHLLKAGHHGSRTSTGEAWLEELRPRWAVISAGEHNLYGHPSPEVLERLERHGIRILRTDLHGAVTAEIRPDGFRVETALRPRRK